jgi:glycosyltransferase involved in cell wall biosynthesis
VDPDTRVEKEVDALLKAGHKVEILAWDRGAKYNSKESDLYFKNGNAKIIRFGIPAVFGGGIKRNLFPLIEFQIKLLKWLYKNRSRYDVIHACDFDTAYISSRIAFRLNKKFVYDIFDYYVDAFQVPGSIKTYIKKLDNNIINNSDAVIICNEKRREQISGTKPKELVIIHNSPSNLDSQSSKELGLNMDKLKIVYVGILSEGRLIMETADFVCKNKDYEYHIGGFGGLDVRLEDMSRRYSNIYFYGKMPYSKTIELENNCDIITALYDPGNPNNQYAAPNKFYEALMLGKPLIMVRNTGMDDIVEMNNVGEIIEYEVKELEKGIRRLVNRRADWDDISKNMKRLYKESYNWHEMENRLTELYSNL